MTWLQAAVLGIVQGLTEFLPISSTAHLRILPHLLGWPDPGAAVSAVIQLGTLVAVFAYFAGDIRRLAAAALSGLRRRNLNDSAACRMAWALIPGTLPIAVLGLVFKDFVETGARSLDLIAAALIVFALGLLLAERIGRRDRAVEDLGFWRIQFVGLCQALALIPGCSRSGATIMGGLFVGLRREPAARFSFLLGLPAIGASGLLEFADLVRSGLGGAGLASLGLAVLAAALAGYWSIGFLLRFIARHGTYAFIVYRVALGLGLLLSR
jgi:undecaprenyl-diphosphatase